MKKRIIFFSEDQEYGSLIDKNLRVTADFEYGGWHRRIRKLVSVIKSTKTEFLVVDQSVKVDPFFIHAVKKWDRSMNVVIISSRNDHDSIRQTLKSGAHGYLIRCLDIEETMEDLRKLAHGGVALSSVAAKSLVTGFWRANNSPLTHTETKVLKFVSLGHTYSSLAKNLDITKGTAKTHLKNIYRKLNIHRKSEALERAYVERLIN
jgi:DNA-binding NarL/FixJ family response regulator